MEKFLVLDLKGQTCFWNLLVEWIYIHIHVVFIHVLNTCCKKAAWLQTPMITRFGVVVLPLSLLFAAASYLENLGDQYLLVWRTYWHPARRRIRKGETEALFERLKLEGFKHLPTILSLKIPIDFPGQIWPKTLFCFGIMPSIKNAPEETEDALRFEMVAFDTLDEAMALWEERMVESSFGIRKATLPK